VGFDAASVGDLNDLWSYDPATGNWTWVGGSNAVGQRGTYGSLGVSDPDNIPGGREAAVFWRMTDSGVYLYGGHGKGSTSSMVGFLGDLWRYDSGVLPPRPPAKTGQEWDFYR
jgi:hypothetical protein